jgi:hypothetical protein
VETQWSVVTFSSDRGARRSLGRTATGAGRRRSLTFFGNGAGFLRFVTRV